MAEAATQTQIPIPKNFAEQAFGESTHSIYRWGAAKVLAKSVELDVGAESYEALVWDDFCTALAELLRSGPEFCKKLYVDRTRRHQIDETGSVLAVDGRRVGGIISNGATLSAELADEHDSWRPQAVRDVGDKITVDKVEALAAGQAYVTVSAAPRQAMKKFPALYKDRLGYSDLAYIQVYAPDGQEMVAGSFSVDDSDVEAWRQLLDEEGFEVPEDVTDDTLIRHGKILEMNSNEAHEFVKTLRQKYNRLRGNPDKQYSINDYIEANQTTVRTLFDTYFPLLADAAYSGANHPAIQDFARTVVQNNQRLDHKIRQQLIEIGRSDKFRPEDVKLLNKVFLYPIIEELRKGLPDWISSGHVPEQLQITNHQIPNETTSIPASVQFVNRLMSWNIRDGIAGGRRYGGCAVTITMGEDSGFDNDLGDSLNLQDAFGGVGSSRGGREKWKIGKGECKVTSCPTKPMRVEIGPCGVCMKRCQKIYDKGGDPTKMTSTRKDIGKQTMNLTLNKPSRSQKFSLGSGENQYSTGRRNNV